MNSVAREVADDLLESARRSRTLQPLKGLVIPAGFWLLINLIHAFSSKALLETTIPLAAMVAYAVFTVAVVASARAKMNRRKDVQYTVALVLGQYNNAILFSLAGFSLRVFLDLTQSILQLPAWVALTGLMGFLLVGLIGLAYSPRSYPTTGEQKHQSADRTARWLPYAVGLPSAGVAIGVALGAYAMHFPAEWEYLLVAGLLIFISYLVLALAVIGTYRTLLLAGASLQSRHA